MPLEMFWDIEQGSPSWYEVRRGIPTSSEFATVLAKGKGGDESKTRRTYLLKLAGEILTGAPMENYTNAHMERGKLFESDARDLYAHYHSVEPSRIGFIRNGRAGCSPDSLLGNDGALEIKSALPHLHLDILLKQGFPPQHWAQCQGVLWVAEREWIDFVNYWPGLPLYVKRAYRDEAYIRDLAAAVDAFNAELDALVERIRAIGAPTPSFGDQLRASLALLSEEPI